MLACDEGGLCSQFIFSPTLIINLYITLSQCDEVQTIQNCGRHRAHGFSSLLSSLAFGFKKNSSIVPEASKATQGAHTLGKKMDVSLVLFFQTGNKWQVA